MKHVMLDIETLGTTPGSVIFAIGAVGFDTDWPLAEIGNYEAEFNRRIFILDSIQLGFKIDQSTVKFWAVQPWRKEYEDASSFSSDSVHTSLIAFKNWYQRFAKGDKALVWGNGVTFDNALLAHYYEALDIELPWTFREDMCFRTLKNLFLECKPEVVNETPHNSLSDARYQAHWLQKILIKIKGV
jgi:hypothetical protein